MEWENEPDREEFEHAGLKCLILRHSELKHLCGYVALVKGHSEYGKHYDEIVANPHGGLTFAQEGNGLKWEEGYWWVGFDCAHAGDLVPGVELLPLSTPLIYRDLTYVRAGVKSLAEQLAEKI